MARLSVLVCLALFATAAYADVCPKFVCGPGNFLYGKFTDPSDPYKEPSDPLNFNSANKAKYWMFEETCLEGSGGICTCYNKLQCKDDKSYSSKWMEPARGVGTVDYEVPANFTVGELCDGNNKGDPHFTGADGSHFDFSGKPNRNYALVSDPHFQMNGFFGGRYSRWNGDH
ncbi:unnamed protein product [Closterium sp. NIES-64]|nr:unnamed protein product [Closterium sp. NIES-64]